MARSVQSSFLATRTTRLKLKRGERHYLTLGDGVTLIYRRDENGFGSWTAKLSERPIKGIYKYSLRRLGAADDHQDADDALVLTFVAAQKKARGLQEDLLRSGGTIKGPLTVAQAVENYLLWFQQHRKSVNETEANINAHILPAFGILQVSALRSKQLREWHTKLASTPARKRSKANGQAEFRPAPTTEDAIRSRKSTANRILTALKAILNKAYSDELVPSRDAWSKVKPFENVDEPIVRYLNTEEALRLTNACPPDLRKLAKAALLTGARYSELTGMKVGDYAAVQKSVCIRPSKSSKARHIPVTAEGSAFFTACGADRPRDEFMFCRADKKPWGKNHHVRPLRSACTTAKIEPSLRFHELRHTYASLLAQAGADLLTISKLLGHADTRITSKHYAHLCDRTLANAVNQFLPRFENAANQDSEVVLPFPKKQRAKR